MATIVSLLKNKYFGHELVTEQSFGSLSYNLSSQEICKPHVAMINLVILGDHGKGHDSIRVTATITVMVAMVKGMCLDFLFPCLCLQIVRNGFHRHLRIG